MEAVRIDSQQRPILFTNCLVFSYGHDLHLKKRHLYVDKGVITGIFETIPENISKELHYDTKGAYVSASWVDLRAHSGEPGYEERERLESLAAAATAGGFAYVCILPNLQPCTQNKETLRYLRQFPTPYPVEFLPYGAITLKNEGVALAEMFDMYAEGCSVFTDGSHSLSEPSMLLKALLYAKNFDATLMITPDEPALSANGQMHEGAESVYLGMRGIPALAEQMGVKRSLDLLEYSEGRLHLSEISSLESLSLIREATNKGLKISCDINAYQLSFLDRDLHTFDTDLKVSPPFREERDRNALLEALEEGTISCIASGHTPLTIEEKVLEFDLATPGIINLQTAFGAIRTASRNVVSLHRIIDALTLGPRTLLGMDVPTFDLGSKADWSFFFPEEEWTFTKKMNLSESENSPYFDKTLYGKPAGILHNGIFCCF